MKSWLEKIPSKARNKGLGVALACRNERKGNVVAWLPMTNRRASVTRLPSFDPESVPVDPAFADPRVRGQAIPAQQLTAAAVRARFMRPLVWQPEAGADLRSSSASSASIEPKPAAVLIPLVVRSGGLHVLLTQRTGHLSDHAGQISFPGGRIESDDADAVAAALRESTEEVGLNAADVDVVGVLPHYLTATHYRVTPVVGLIECLPELKLDRFEVAEAFEVPLEFLMNPAHHELRAMQWQGQRRAFYAMPYLSTRRYFIWGATAAMLRNLYRFLSAN